MVLAKPPTYTADEMRTPFVKLDDGNRWTLFLLEGYAIEWGHRFEPAHGYFVFIKYAGAINSNLLTAAEARRLANVISKGEQNETILNIGIVMKQSAATVERLNTAWIAAGRPDGGMIGNPMTGTESPQAGHA